MGDRIAKHLQAAFMPAAPSSAGCRKMTIGRCREALTIVTVFTHSRSLVGPAFNTGAALCDKFGGAPVAPLPKTFRGFWMAHPFIAALVAP
jgi:hypothetical protein